MKNNEAGVTLVELLVAIALAGIVSTVIYTAYQVQMKVYQDEDDVVQMQQNIRSALAFLQAETRMAGYNLGGETSDKSCSANPATGSPMAPGIHTATVNKLGFSMDLNGDGDCADDGENVLYQLHTSGGIQKLGRDDLTDAQPQQSIADYIETMEFIYAFAPPRKGSPVVKAPTSSPASAKFEDLRSVVVSLLVRAEAPDTRIKQPTSYSLPTVNAWGEIKSTGGTVVTVADDKVRRRALSTMINFRNMGL